MCPETSNNVVKTVNCDLEISIMSQFEVWEKINSKNLMPRVKQFARVD